MGNNKNTDEIEIDLREIFAILMDKLKWIVLVGIVCAGAAFLVTALLITPKYESKTSVYILSKQNSDTTSYSDLQTSAMLAEDCTALIKSRSVTGEVIKKLSLNMKEDALIKNISVDGTSQSGRVVEIKVTHTDPAMAQKLANTVREVASEKFVDTMDLQAVNVVDEANYPEKASNISYKKNVVLGFVAGIFVSAAIFVIVFLMNSKIRTQDDVEKYLGLSVLGVIPDSDEGKNTEELVNANRKKASSKKKKSPDSSGKHTHTADGNR